jgi:hypothetical protein
VGRWGGGVQTADNGQVPVQAKTGLFNNKPLTIYKPHQMLIAELEIEAVGTEFSKRTSWGTCEDLRRARTWKFMKNMNFSDMYKNQTNAKTCRIHIFLDEAGCILNEKMMPDLTVMVPELEINRIV